MPKIDQKTGPATARLTGLTPTALGLVAGALILLTLLTVSENALESRPFSRGNKYLIACNGDQISLTCTHGNVVSGSTRWIISPPVNCASNIIHDLPIDAPQCGPFTFHSVTEAVQGVTQLSSTAIATASTMMSGSVVECRGGNVIASSSVGNLTLCIVGPINNLQCAPAPNGLIVTWDAATEGRCAESSFNYTVTIANQTNNSISYQTEVNDNGTEILNVLETNQNYTVSVTTDFCINDPAASIVCETGSYSLTETTESSISGVSEATVSIGKSENSLLSGVKFILIFSTFAMLAV